MIKFWSVTYRQNVEWDIEFGVGRDEWEDKGEVEGEGSPKVAGSVQGQVFNAFSLLEQRIPAANWAMGKNGTHH